MRRGYVKMVSPKVAKEAKKIEAENEAAMKRRQSKEAKAATAKAAKAAKRIQRRLPKAATIAQAQSVIAEDTRRTDEQRNAVEKERATPTSGDTATEVEHAGETPAEAANRRDLVKQLNDLRVEADDRLWESNRGNRLRRRDKSALDHPSLTKGVRACLRRVWLAGEVWLSDDRLHSLLCQLLGEAGEKTGRKQLVAIRDWSKVASELANWTTGANKGPATEAGSFQLALAKERTVEHNTGPVTQNIIAHWMSILLLGANLNDIADKKYSFKANIDIVVHGPAAIDYIMHINHELVRRNNRNSKKSAAGQVEWYAVSDQTRAAWDEAAATTREEAARGAAAREEQQRERQQQFNNAAQQFNNEAAAAAAALEQRRAAAKKSPTKALAKKSKNATVIEVLEKVTDAELCSDTGRILYRCRWVGFTPDHDTWEPHENICDNPEFHKYLQLDENHSFGGHSFDIRSEENHPKVVAKKQRAPKRKQPSKTSNPTVAPTMAPEKAPKQAKCEPDREAKDKSYLQAGSKIWVEYYDAGAELKWFKAKVVIVSPTSEVPSASVVRVHFSDGQKTTLNLMCQPGSDKLEKQDPEKYEQFDWSTKPTFSDKW